MQVELTLAERRKIIWYLCTQLLVHEWSVRPSASPR